MYIFGFEHLNTPFKVAVLRTIYGVILFIAIVFWTHHQNFSLTFLLRRIFPCAYRHILLYLLPRVHSSHTERHKRTFTQSRIHKYNQSLGCYRYCFLSHFSLFRRVHVCCIAETECKNINEKWKRQRKKKKKKRKKRAEKLWTHHIYIT